MFISVNGKAKKVAEIFAGGTDGKAHKVTQLFGSVDGVAKQLFTVAPAETNGFDTYTWADIKQMANDGQLLEHFNLYDRVTIKLKTPLESELNVYLTGYGVYKKMPQKQYEMVFQIVELTEIKMRLMCPRVNALGIASTNITSSSYPQEYISKAWGMTPMYTALKTIQSALPDDLTSVLSICERPMIYYGRHPITEKVIVEYDEDMKVRQLTTSEFLGGYNSSNPNVVYPIIVKSYFPTTVGEYLYHIQLPEEYDTYEQRRYMVKWLFDGFKFLDHKSTGSSYTQSWCDAPYASCYFSKGILTNDEFDDYNDSGRVLNGLPINVPTSCNTIFPEIIIEKD